MPKPRILPVADQVVTLETTSVHVARLAARIRRGWRVEPVEWTHPGSLCVWLECYFISPRAAGLAVRAARHWLGVRAAGRRVVRPADWQAAWRRQFHCRAIGTRLEICPVWERHAARRVRRRIRVLVNPGMSFGTGDHFTTRFCLEQLDSLCAAHAPRSLLDLGAGSGILAVAAARLGVRRVIGVDNDPEAVGQAQANARLNRVGRRAQFRAGDVTMEWPRGRFEIVCANLFAGLLQQVADPLTRSAARWLILSGVREAEADDVADTYRARGWREGVRDGDGEWCGLTFRRSPRR